MSSPLSDSALEDRHTLAVLGVKWRVANNAVRNIKGHLWLHMVVGLGLVFVLVGGGTGLFHMVFRFLMSQPVFGAPLMDRLVGIVFLIFFSMLLFSNLIITLSTTYLNKEVEFLMALPVSRGAIFAQKLFESIVYSSWAFAVLSFPLFASFGAVRGAPLYFYPLIVVLVVPFLTIPAALAAMVTMLITSWLPARKTRLFLAGVGILTMTATVVTAKVTGMGRLLSTANQQDFLQIMNALAVGNSPMLPSAWLSNALQAIAPADPADRNMMEFLYWWGMLVATALFLLEACRWLVPPLYYRGWCLSRDAAVREVESHARFSIFRFVDGWLERLFASPTAALLSKDLKTFWRDPTQWPQLLILFGLMVVYTSNLRWSSRYNKTIELVVNDWKTVLSYFNLAATCFILSILTTRFVYPLLSLEGRGFWTVGLAPIHRSRIVWQKYVLCLLLCLAVALPLTVLSNFILQIETRFMQVGYITVVLMCLGLTSMSVGIGAILPDFKEDNPARIANGVGGTLNVLLSLLYIGVTVAMLVAPLAFLSSARTSADVAPYLVPYALLVLLMHALVIVLPMRIGLKRWNDMEF